VRIVTASQDSDDSWGCTDLAIGFCKPHRSPEFGVKKLSGHGGSKFQMPCIHGLFLQVLVLLMRTVQISGAGIYMVLGINTSIID